MGYVDEGRSSFQRTPADLKRSLVREVPLAVDEIGHDSERFFADAKEMCEVHIWIGCFGTLRQTTIRGPRNFAARRFVPERGIGACWKFLPSTFAEAGDLNLTNTPEF